MTIELAFRGWFGLIHVASGAHTVHDANEQNGGEVFESNASAYKGGLMGMFLFHLSGRRSNESSL